jgi:hypothetical protein
MLSPTVLKRHAALVDDMGNAQGVDLEEKMLRGTVTFDALDDAVLRCTACENPSACEAWLAKSPSGAEVPPNYCRNQDFFADLK